METKANYVLIGAFALAGFLGILAFFLWFAQVELDRQFAYYDIDFSTVSGLSSASEVRFSGLPVGQVVDVGLAPDQSGSIRVRIEVGADTPVREDSVATIEMQGVTGVAYVGLTAGSPESPLLKPGADGAVPMIGAGRSVLQSLSEDAPQVVEEVLSVTRQLGEILGPENQARITNILANLEGSSENLGQVLEDFSAVTATVADASEEIASFSARLEEISNAATTALNTADDTLGQIKTLAVRAEGTLDRADGALDSGRRALDTADTVMTQNLPEALADLAATTEAVRSQLELVSTDARAMMQEFRETGSLASARLTEAEATLQSTDAMLERMTQSLESFDSASVSFQALVDGDGAALVAEGRALVANAGKVVDSARVVAETDLPAIVEDIRTATATAARVVEEVGADLSAAAGRIDGLSEDASQAMATVSDTFTRANDTLTKLDSALAAGEKALASADGAFTSADRVLNDEVATIAADVRAMLGRVDTAVAQVSADLPQITADLRDMAGRANSAFAEIERTVQAASPPVQDFAREGLPQFTRLARESSALVATLEQLVKRIERDPTRYLLGRDVPEFRR